MTITVTIQVNFKNFNKTKNVENAKISNFKRDIFSNFQTFVKLDVKLDLKNFGRPFTFCFAPAL